MSTSASNSSARVSAVVQLLRGTLTAAELAQRHGVDEAEIERWKALFLAGADASALPRKPGWWGRAATSKRQSQLAIAAGLTVCLGAGVAFSQAAVFPIAITVFKPNTPAVASEVNTNFANLKAGVESLKASVETKVGVLTTNSSTLTAPVTVKTATTTGLALGSGSYLGGGSATGAEITNDVSNYKSLMIVGNTSAGGAREISLWDNVKVATRLTASSIGAVGDVAGGTLTSNGALSVGGAATIGGNLNVVGTVQTGNRYIVQAPYNSQFAASNTASASVAIDQTKLLALCGDADGCLVRLVMKDWNGGRQDASFGPLHFEYDPSGQFRSAEIAGYGPLFYSTAEAQAVDGNNVVNFALRAWNCYLTDASYTVGTGNATDSAAGMYVLNYNADNYRAVCTLIIDD